jgi:threonylcarbamoyladenosine tRNA methylthiotransferase MtaB
MLSFSVHTIGCKLNQLESEAVAGAFRGEGFLPADPPDLGDSKNRPYPRLLVINTCTVTSMAEQKARRLIRGALREGTWVLVTGCYAQLNAAELEALEGEGQGRLFVIPGDKKSALLELPRFLNSHPGEDPLVLIRDWLLKAGGDGPEGRFRFAPEDFSSHSRAFLKIQDGCDRHCTYCRVRIARGGNLSLPPEEVLRRLRFLEARGWPEAVLTGVNICRYSPGSAGPGGLGVLIEHLLGGTERIRLRLSSLEPEDIDGALLKSLNNERLRPHFHLSIQSGSRRVLERMGRSYGPEQAAWAVSRLREQRGDPFLACDIITGFPGEGDAEFEETLEFCEGMDFAWIHSFPYSPRPGTAAWGFSGLVPQREAAARAAKLLDMARRGRRNYVRRWLGKELELVLEDRGRGKRGPEGRGTFPGPAAARKRTDPPEPSRDTPWGGTSENYLKLLVPSAWLPRNPGPGGILRCRVREFPGPPEGHGPAPGGVFQAGGGEFDALGDPR